jgi:hypothetical protein
MTYANSWKRSGFPAKEAVPVALSVGKQNGAWIILN